RKILVGIGCAGLAAGGVCLARGPLGLSTVQVAAADPQAAEIRGTPGAVGSPSSVSEYSSSFVAVFADGKQGITKEELGEYLIARYGEKVEHLINRRIIEDACKARGIEVTAKEVEQKLTEDMKDLNIDRARFVKDFLRAAARRSM